MKHRAYLRFIVASKLLALANYIFCFLGMRVITLFILQPTYTNRWVRVTRHQDGLRFHPSRCVQNTLNEVKM
jgi:capsular polysaccharide biosynthesis protein